MLALIAGTGDLPVALAARAKPGLVCAMAGFEPKLRVDIPFRIEHLGSFLNVLTEWGVTEVCMAGAIRRPPVDPNAIDTATRPLVPRIQAAIAAGDDGALRTIIAIFEERGFAIRAAHEIAPDLLPSADVLTDQRPTDLHVVAAQTGDLALRDMGATDAGQACIVRGGNVLMREGPDGTDAMLKRFRQLHVGPGAETIFDDVTDVVSGALGSVADWLSGPDAKQATQGGSILFKAPKPQQDRRADLPVIGLGTAEEAVKAGLDGIVIEAGGVMVLGVDAVVEKLNSHGLFLWVRPPEAA